MSNKLVIIGGGLWGGLLAFRLTKLHPEVEFILYEEGATFGGNHTWSFHTSDISAKAMDWLSSFIEKSWKGYKVKFPEYERAFTSGYHSISSEKFHQTLISSLAPTSYRLNQKISLEDALKLSSWVIDARGTFSFTGAGYQKFLGIECELETSHGLDFPILMDATVEQVDGYRFIYYLPFSKTRILIEDTYYSSNPHFNRSEVTERIKKVIKNKGWTIKHIIREEEGILPLPYSSVHPKNSMGVASLGGIFHDTTGYSLPDAVRFIESSLDTVFDPAKFNQQLLNYRMTRKADRTFFKLLNRLLFTASSEQQRYKVLQFFYRGPTNLIEKFYAGELSAWDKIRFFWGKPPVPVLAAMKTLCKREEA